MNKDEVLKIALHALELANYYVADYCNGNTIEEIDDAITAIKEALAQPEQEQFALKHRIAELEGAVIGLQARLAQPEQEPVAWADKCRIELVNVIHFLASDFENALGAFRSDTEARRKAEGDIAHARSIASRWNWNGTTEPAQQQEPVKWSDYELDGMHHNKPSPPASKPWVGLTEQERNDLEDYCEMIIGKAAFEAIEAKLKEKNV